MHRRLSLGAPLLLIAVCLAANANAAEVYLAPRGDLSLHSGELVIRSSSGDETIHSLRNFKSLSISAGEASVTCRGERLWCPDLPLRGDTVELPVFPTMRVTARLTGRGAAAQHTTGTVQGIVRGEPPARPLEFRQALSIRDGEIAFEAPRAGLDLRFALSGAAPVYRWGVDPPAAGAEAAAVRLGDLPLHPGGSLSGWVMTRDDELPVDDATIVALPVSATDAGSTPLREWEVTSGENGFFQVHGLEPGTYRLQLSAADLVSQAIEAVEVAEGSETLIGTVLLPSPIRVSFQLTPPLDPRGRPWKLTLRPAHPLPGEPAAEAMAAVDGTGVISSLRIAEYVVQVVSSDGDALLFERRRISGDDWLTLEVPVAEVRGTVSLGAEPISATVVVETGDGDRAELESGEDGELSGWMRKPEPPWALATVSWSEGDERRQRKVEVVPDVEEELVRLDIDLPTGAIFGDVVDAEGRSQSGVRVLATPVEGATQFTEVRGVTDRNGRFHLTGLEEEPYLLQAGGNGSPASEVVMVDLSGDLPAGDVRLVLWPTRRIEGQLTAGTQPVAGALVAIEGVGRVPVSVEAPTNAQGRFAFELPESVTRVVVKVSAPSRVLWSACVPVDGEELHLALPTSPAGRLSLSSSSRADLPPTTRGQLVLLTGDGGFLAFGQLLRWSTLRNAQWSVEQEGNRLLQRLPVPGLPPGSYALTWSGAPAWELAARTCARAFSGADWVALAPDGEAEVHLDLFTMQERAEVARGAEGRP